jgi:hypothetical protein
MVKRLETFFLFVLTLSESVWCFIVCELLAYTKVTGQLYPRRTSCLLTVNLCPFLTEAYPGTGHLLPQGMGI